MREPDIAEGDMLITKVKSKHGWQSEVRAIWEPAQTIKNKHEIFVAHEVRGFCKIHAQK